RQLRPPGFRLEGEPALFAAIDEHQIADADRRELGGITGGEPGAVLVHRDVARDLSHEAASGLSDSTSHGRRFYAVKAWPRRPSRGGGARARAQTPSASAPQMYLCAWSWRRTGR